MRSAIPRLRHLFIVAIALLATGAARADEYFMKLSGSSPGIFGESTVKGYENWIQLDSVGFGVAADSSWIKGGGASVGKPIPADLTWSQSFDSSVPSMYVYMLQGKAVPDATVEYVQQGNSGPVTYLQLSMTGLFFTGLAFDGNTVHGSGVFKTIEMTYWTLADNGTREKSVHLAWDIPAGTASGGGLTGTFGPGDLSPSPVPEPGTYALMLAGLLVVGVVARKRSAH